MNIKSRESCTYREIYYMIETTLSFNSTNYLNHKLQMMKKNLYYQRLYRRDSLVNEFLDHIILAIASPFKLLIEVFIRRHFGERYFRLSSVISTTAFMFLIPGLLIWLSNGVSILEDDESRSSYATWFIYALLFFVMGMWRESEITRSYSNFDFTRFSLSSGQTYGLFVKLGTVNGKPNFRRIETLIEPAPFFIAGIILAVLGQNLGYLLIFSSLMYSYSYAASYRIGDDFVLDKIDEMITNQELEKTLLDGVEEGTSDTFRYRGSKPADPDLRKKLLSSMVVDDGVVEAQ